MYGFLASKTLLTEDLYGCVIENWLSEYGLIVVEYGVVVFVQYGPYGLFVVE